jgi:hypothetical protein
MKLGVDDSVFFVLSLNEFQGVCGHDPKDKDYTSTSWKVCVDMNLQKKTKNRTERHCRRTEGNLNTQQFDYVVVNWKKKGFSD